MELFTSLINHANTILWSYVMIYMLIGLGIFYTLRLWFVQIRMIPEMLRLIFNPKSRAKNEQISPFQAFCVSVASHVGVGNIAGVAIAIVMGGPGAVFWMWIIAFIGSASSFTENTLAQIYKVKNADGKFHGGPAYYIQNALHMPILARIFAVLLAVTFGLIYNSVQANTIADSLNHAFGIDVKITAAVLGVLTAAIIFGGIKRIARITSMIVPFMALAYILLAAVVIVINLGKVPEVIYLIFHDAFSPQAAVSGGLGAAILMGVKRGLFSNEAGEGSIPNAAATADTKHPAAQGLIHAFGVYVDTWFICSATAFIILLAGNYEIGNGDLKGIAVTQSALAVFFGEYAPKFLSCFVFLFAFSSIIGNYFYGEINVEFFGKMGKSLLQIFRILVICMVVFGSLAGLGLVWDLADVFMGLLCVTNLFAITMLFGHAKIALDDYVAQKKAGISEPEFDIKTLENKLKTEISERLEGVKEWK